MRLIELTIGLSSVLPAMTNRVSAAASATSPTPAAAPTAAEHQSVA